MRRISNVHPGEILFEDFIKPLNLSQYKVAKDIHVAPIRINAIIHGTRSISADTALRLGRYFGNSAQFWLNLQTHFDLEEQKDKLLKRLDVEVHPLPTSKKKAA